MKKKYLLIALSIGFIPGIKSKVSESKNTKYSQKNSSQKNNSVMRIADNELIHDDNLEHFLASMSSDQEEKKEFRGYYSKFLRTQNRRHRIRKRRRLQSLRNKALNDIEVRKPELYANLEPYIIDIDESPTCRTQRLYLTRYALFQEFKENQAMKNLTIWGKTKRYAKNAASKVGKFSKRVVNKFTA